MIKFKGLERFHFAVVFPNFNKKRGKVRRILGKEIDTFALMKLETPD